jgi:cell division protein FtsA
VPPAKWLLPAGRGPITEGDTIAHDQVIVGIDVGTTKVCTLIADVADEVPEVLGVGIAPSQGIRKGVVVDVQAAVEAVSASLHRAEQQSGFKAISAFVGIADSHVLSTNNHAVVAVRHPDNVVMAEDVTRVIDAARVVQLPADQEILHVIPRFFVVDGVDGIRDPVGMIGRRLEVEANIVTGSTTSIRNLVRAIEGVGVDLDAIVLQPVAAGRAVLSETERDLGAMVIDMGGGTTDLALFRDGGVVHVCSLPVGGYQLTNDLSVGLRTSFPVAEELKIKHGSTTNEARPDGELVTVTTSNREPPYEVDQRTIAEILDARMAETFEVLLEGLARAGFQDSYPSGVVLAGGSSQIPGAAELAAEVFGVPTRVGRPRVLRGLVDTIRGPAFATSVGLLIWGEERVEPIGTNGMPGGFGRIGSTVRTWLRNFLG